MSCFSAGAVKGSKWKGDNNMEHPVTDGEVATVNCSCAMVQSLPVFVTLYCWTKLFPLNEKLKIYCFFRVSWGYVLKQITFDIVLSNFNE